MITIVKFNFIIFKVLIKLKLCVNKINPSTTIPFADEFIEFISDTFSFLRFHLPPHTARENVYMSSFDAAFALQI